MTKGRLSNSFKFALRGFVVALKEQANLRIHLTISIFVLIAAFVLKVSSMEWLILIICIGMVVSLELVNSAIESLVDMVSPEWREQAGKIKDIAAAAVLFASLLAGCIGLVIFGTHLVSLYA
jgi:diacylglycerol kinase